jgi:hypothetical protein
MIVSRRRGPFATEYALIDPNAYACSTTLPTDDPQHRDHGGIVRLPPTQ